MQINIEKKHFWVLVVMISLIAVAVFVYALQTKGASTSNEFGHYSFDVEGIEPDYESDWVKVDSSSDNEVKFKFGSTWEDVPSRYSLLHCDSLDSQYNKCGSRVVLSGGYSDGTVHINPVSVTADNSIIYVSVTKGWNSWGYWYGNWKYSSDSISYYKVLAWK